MDGVRRILEVVKNCERYAVGAAGEALCAEAVDVVLKALDVVLKVLDVVLKVPDVVRMLEVVNGVRCVQWVMYKGLELRTLRAVSCASCSGGREGRAACAVLRVHGRCLMYAGGCTLYARDAGRYAQ